MVHDQVDSMLVALIIVRHVYNILWINMFFNPQLKLFEKPALSTAVETAWLAASSNRSSDSCNI